MTLIFHSRNLTWMESNNIANHLKSRLRICFWKHLLTDCFRWLVFWKIKCPTIVWAALCKGQVFPSVSLSLLPCVTASLCIYAFVFLFPFLSFRFFFFSFLSSFIYSLVFLNSSGSWNYNQTIIFCPLKTWSFGFLAIILLCWPSMIRFQPDSNQNMR